MLTRRILTRSCDDRSGMMNRLLQKRMAGQAAELFGAIRSRLEASTKSKRPESVKLSTKLAPSQYRLLSRSPFFSMGDRRSLRAHAVSEAALSEGYQF